MTQQQTMSRQSQSGSQMGGQTAVDINTIALDPKEIKSVLLGTQWNDVENAELVQFAVSQPHSPASPSNLYPGLRYTNQFGKSVVTPLRNILGYSNEQQSKIQQQSQSQSFASASR